MTVEPRLYRLRLLNGCDSRFLVIQFKEVDGSATDPTDPSAGSPIEFKVIGGDQGLHFPPQKTTRLIIETGARYDIIVDFSAAKGKRVIMENLGGDEPFKGDIPDLDEVSLTNRIMAFDVLAAEYSDSPHQRDIKYDSVLNPPELLNKTPDRVRKVALFEGRDEYSRLQPILGTAEPATDAKGMAIHWPDDSAACNGGCTMDCPYTCADLNGKQIEGSAAWHSPTTENPKLGDVEEWEIWNVSVDAHPIHLHLVHFEVVSRHEIIWDDNNNIDDPECKSSPGNPTSGICLETQAVVQHNGKLGQGFKIVYPNTCSGGVRGNCYRATADLPDGLIETSRKDMVTALPGQVTKIRAKFDKPGPFVWHCHILSHEDHEMMRLLFVSGGYEKWWKKGDHHI